MLLAHFYRRLLLRHCFEQLRSTQVAVVHCSAQTSPMHVLQKLQQSCMVISSNTGRVYRPKDCERLVLYLKDLNLPKPDKWGTSQLIAFLQQVKLVLLAFVFFTVVTIKLVAMQLEMRMCYRQSRFLIYFALHEDSLVLEENVFRFPSTFSVC